MIFIKNKFFKTQIKNCHFYHKQSFSLCKSLKNLLGDQSLSIKDTQENLLVSNKNIIIKTV